MIVAEARISRACLDLAPLAVENFAFLEEVYGFKLVERGETRVRYRLDRCFINIFHGRASFQVGVEVGRARRLGVKLREEVFPLSYLMAVEAGETELSSARTAVDRDQLEHELSRLSNILKELIGPLLDDINEAFDRMNKLSKSRSSAYLERARASKLRASADAAWRRSDFPLVVEMYSAIDEDLASVDLLPSERGRLEYANKRMIQGV